MVEISDIRDRESLRAWLEGQPQRFSVVIAHRAAMRVLPEYWRWVQTSERARNSDLTALPILWPNLISEAVAFCPTPEIKDELRSATTYATATASATDAATAYAAATTYATATATAADAAATATAATAATGYATAAADAAIATAATATAYATAADAAAVWEMVRSDCQLLLERKALNHVPLWGAGSNPLQATWTDTQQALAEDAVDWGFWIKWYEAALDGKPLPYALLERIALEVKEEDWKQGPKHVNGLIAGIEASFLRDSTPLSERLLVEEDSGEVYSEPVEAKNPELMATHLHRIKDALARALKSNNGLTDASLEVEILSDLFSKYRNDAERVEMDLVEVVGSLNSQISNGWLPDSPAISSLMRSCRQGALDIRAMNPELAENRAIRARQAARELTIDEKAELEAGIAAIKPILRADLGEQFEGDFKRLNNDAIGPPPEGAPPLPAPDPAMRMANRVAKVSLMVRLDETVKKLEKNPLYRAGAVATQLAALVTLLYTVFTVIG